MEDLLESEQFILGSYLSVKQKKRVSHLNKTILMQVVTF